MFGNMTARTSERKGATAAAPRREREKAGYEPFDRSGIYTLNPTPSTLDIKLYALNPQL